MSILNTVVNVVPKSATIPTLNEFEMGIKDYGTTHNAFIASEKTVKRMIEICYAHPVAKQRKAGRDMLLTVANSLRTAYQDEKDSGKYKLPAGKTWDGTTMTLLPSYNLYKTFQGMIHKVANEFESKFKPQTIQIITHKKGSKKGEKELSWLDKKNRKGSNTAGRKTKDPEQRKASDDLDSALNKMEGLKDTDVINNTMLAFKRANRSNIRIVTEQQLSKIVNDLVKAELKKAKSAVNKRRTTTTGSRSQRKVA